MSDTETINFWKGDFGNEYTERNTRNCSNNYSLFTQVISSFTTEVKSVLELGSNIGLNLQALQTLLPECKFSAVEVNDQAATICKASCPDIDVYCMPIQRFTSDHQWDFVFTKGVLIHISPDDLDAVYEKIYSLSGRYILLAEYYNPTPVEIEYRGNKGKLFKRDFAGEMLDKHHDLSLANYGFFYHRDKYFHQDDISWFLLQKNA